MPLAEAEESSADLILLTLQRGLHLIATSFVLR